MLCSASRLALQPAKAHVAHVRANRMICSSGRCDQARRHSASHQSRTTLAVASALPAGAGASAATAVPPPEAAPQDQAPGAAFSWTKQWYAVAVAGDIDTTRPYPFTLLGQPIVIWWDGEAWRCVEDRCPHRAAPLSEGMIWDDGSLLCSYHGWRFRGGDGACVALPQAASEAAQAAACANPRACAATRPLRVCMGILFVWGESGPNAAAEAAAAKPTLLADWEESGEKLKVLFKPYHRDLPYDYQTLIENVVDPAHVPFSHHGLQGSRDKVKFGDYEMRRLDPGNPFRVGPASIFDEVELHPPSAIAYKLHKPDGTWSCFISFATPTTPGACRIVAQSVNNLKEVPPMFKLLALFPRWFEHIMTRHSVLDGDSVFLPAQEHKVVEEARALEAARACAGDGTAAASQAWRRLYFVPAAADMLVLAFRNWLNDRAGGGPFGPLHRNPAYPPLVTDRRVLLDRWQSHTIHCKDCTRAFRIITLLRTVAAAASAAACVTSLFTLLAEASSASAAAAAAASSGGGAGAAAAASGLAAVLAAAAARVPAAALGWAGMGLALALAWRVLSNLQQRFIFVDYVHATRR